jgi:pseudouridylate synthase
VSLRDLSIVLARHTLGATTVAATAAIAHAMGIKVFATGGLGGVHRGASSSYDESADLFALANTPITVICAGVKSILDIPATLERMETLSIGLVGYRTDTFPGFYIRETSERVPFRVESPDEIVKLMHLRQALRQTQALVVANPIPEAKQMARDLHDRVLADALAALEAGQVRGKEVTPHLLAFFHQHTHGVSLAANIALVLNNAQLAAQIAAQIVGQIAA